MKIVDVEVIPYALPFREPYVTARGRLEQREMVLLRLRDADGLVGLGEAVPLSMRGGVTLEQVVAELEALSPARPSADLPLSQPSRCAVHTALLDLDEKRSAEVEARPVAVPCNATLVSGEPTAVAEDALRWAAEGFSTFKLKLGTERDVEQVAAVREALGLETQIRIDVNGAWDLPTATRALAELEPFEIQLAEQPVATMEEAAELARSTPIPLAADESVESRADARRAVESGAFSLTGIKLSKVGGLPLALQIAEALPAYVSSALDGPIGIAAGARLASKLSHLPWPARGERSHGLATQRLFSSTIASVECELRDGMLHPPAGPGLGIEIDEEALQAHRLST